MTKAIDEAEARLDQLLATKERWKPDLWIPAISPVAVEGARRLLRDRPALVASADVSPNYEGGVRLDIVVGDMGTDIDFESDGKVDLCGFRKDGSGYHDVVAATLDDGFMRTLDERIPPTSETSSGLDPSHGDDRRHA